MKSIVIDCSAVESEDAFWSAYVLAVKPEGVGYFGRNLNAFWDALMGGGPGWPGKCQLRFTNTSSLQSLNGGLFLDALRNIQKHSTWVKIKLE